MDSMITAAARALAAGDPLGALKRVSLRDDASALALRGIAMAQLGDLVRAKALLRLAARAFGPKEVIARAPRTHSCADGRSGKRISPTKHASGAPDCTWCGAAPSARRGRSVAGIQGARVDACRHVVRHAGTVISITGRPVLFALTRCAKRSASRQGIWSEACR
jgi:hypothetical protein